MKRIISLLVISHFIVQTIVFAQNTFSASTSAIDSYFSKLESFGLSGSLFDCKQKWNTAKKELWHR